MLMETVSNPILRVGELDKIAAITKKYGAALVVDNTFSSPLLIRPLEHGANFSVHSATKYLAGHGDVLGGLIIADEAHLEPLRAYSRIAGPIMGPFEAYLTMRGIKTFPLRMERQCKNANEIAKWLMSNTHVDKVFFTGDPNHPDADVIARLFPKDMTGAIVSFEVKGAGKQGIFHFMDSLKMILRGTSLGDVHSLVLYPLIASHRDLSPKQRLRMGIKDNLVRLSVGAKSKNIAETEIKPLFYAEPPARRDGASAPRSAALSERSSNCSRTANPLFGLCKLGFGPCQLSQSGSIEHHRPSSRGRGSGSD